VRGALLVALFALQGCASLGSGEHCASPEALAGNSATIAAEGRLSVLTWNVHGLPFDDSVPPRMNAIAREIRSRAPDLVLLQEAWLDVEAARLGCKLAEDYQRVPDAPGVRSGMLGLFGHRRGGLLAFVRRASPWRLDPAVPVAFTEYSQSAPWYRLSEMDGVAGKGVQRFVIGDAGRRVVVLNTHVQAQYPARGNPYDEVRRSQLAELLREARRPMTEHAEADAVLVAGDLNVRPEEAPLYGALAAELQDFTAPYRRACGGCGTFVARDGSEAWWIDYVTARAGGAARVARVDRIRNEGRDQPFSDHHGVWVELIFDRLKP
jgi:endonuclease/exonuclease/phosphatase family metal-dependent hydrolase